MFKDMVKACKNYYETPSVEAWNQQLKTYRITGIKTTENGVQLRAFCVKFSPDGDEFYCGLENGVVQLRRSCDGYLIQSFSYPNDFCHISAMKSIKKLRMHYLFAANGNGNIFVSNVLKRHHSPFAFELNNEINSIDVNVEHTHLISAGKDAAVRVYDVPTNKLLSKYGGSHGNCQTESAQYHTLRIADCKFNPNNQNIFVSGGYDDIVKIWDLREKGCFVRNCRGPRIRGESIVFDNDHLLLGCCRINKGIQRWDIASGKMIENINYRNSTTFLNGYFTHCMKLMRVSNGDHFLLVGGTGRKTVDVVCLESQTRLMRVCTNSAAINFDCYKDHVVIAAHNYDLEMTHFNHD